MDSHGCGSPSQGDLSRRRDLSAATWGSPRAKIAMACANGQDLSWDYYSGPACQGMAPPTFGLWREPSDTEALRRAARMLLTLDEETDQSPQVPPVPLLTAMRCSIQRRWGSLSASGAGARKAEEARTLVHPRLMHSAPPTSQVRPSPALLHSPYLALDSEPPRGVWPQPRSAGGAQRPPSRVPSRLGLVPAVQGPPLAQQQLSLTEVALPTEGPGLVQRRLAETAGQEAGNAGNGGPPTLAGPPTSREVPLPCSPPPHKVLTSEDCNWVQDTPLQLPPCSVTLTADCGPSASGGCSGAPSPPATPFNRTQGQSPGRGLSGYEQPTCSLPAAPPSSPRSHAHPLEAMSAGWPLLRTWSDPGSNPDEGGGVSDQGPLAWEAPATPDGWEGARHGPDSPLLRAPDSGKGAARVGEVRVGADGAGGSCLEAAASSRAGGEEGGPARPRWRGYQGHPVSSPVAQALQVPRYHTTTIVSRLGTMGSWGGDPAPSRSPYYVRDMHGC
ncbi:hypothetical protein V8C86DRAFT_3141767 [Haematococcus lacustris]